MVSEQRSTWTRWNLYAETERQLRSSRFATARERDAVTDAVVGCATGPALSIRIDAPEFVLGRAPITGSLPLGYAQHEGVHRTGSTPGCV